MANPFDNCKYTNCETCLHNIGCDEYINNSENGLDNIIENISSNLKEEREEYDKLVHRVIDKFLYNRELKAKIYMFKIKRDMLRGKRYYTRYYGKNIMIEDVISVHWDKHTEVTKHLLNLSSMENCHPRIKCAVKNELGEFIEKSFIYYSIKESVYPDFINPKDYKF